MTDKEYRKHPAISRSELFKMCDSPEKFKFYKDNEVEITPSLLFGQLFHKMVLEPETLFDEFVIEPKVDKRTKEGKALYADFLENAKDKKAVPPDMFKKAEEMTLKLLKDKTAVNILKGKHEVPFFWKDKETGEECKVRVDSLYEQGDTNIIVDLKTASKADTGSFSRDAVKFGYDFQSGFYKEGVDICTGKKHLFVFLVIEKEPPYSINVLEADELFIKRGNLLFHDMLKLYHKCRESNNWYGYRGEDNKIQMLNLPNYLAKELE